jgi:putative ABC transport system permease protein
MSVIPPESQLRARRLLRPRALIYFYRRRLRAHAAQELLAGVGIAAAVALVLAAVVAQGSIASANRRVIHAVVGSADLQLVSRGPTGMPESLLTEVESVPGIKQAAPVLYHSLHVVAPGGRSENIYVIGADTALGVLDGLGRTLPIGALKENTIELSASSVSALGLSAARRPLIDVLVGGRRETLPVVASLSSRSVGALAETHGGIMALATMQTLLHTPHMVTSIVIESKPGQHAAVKAALKRIASGRVTVAGADEDVELLEQALRPAGQASTLFAIIGALLGFLLAFNAILLTVPERRQVIADLRMTGTRPSAIIQLALFQAACLGLAASCVGLGVGYILSRFVFAQSTGYLAQAFAQAEGTVVSTGTLVIAALSGVLMTCVASSVPLLDLWPSRPADAIHTGSEGVPGDALSPRLLRPLAVTATCMLALASVLYALAPSAALVAAVTLALATVLAAPLVFAGLLRGARAVSRRFPRWSTLALALGGIRGTAIRSVALVATGAVALFGSVALGGARGNLISGIHRFAHAYSADAPIWVAEPGESGQATGRLADASAAAKLRSLPGVASVEGFQGTFMTLGDRRVWLIARPPGAARRVLESQSVGGPTVARVAERHLSSGGWVVVSEQIARELHAHVGQPITLPTPTGNRAYRVAALTTNLAWPPGVLFMGASDYSRAFQTDSPSALAVQPSPGTSLAAIMRAIRTALGPSSGLEVASASNRQAHIDKLTGEGLAQLGIVSLLLIIAAILALAAALTSAIYQRRPALAGLRLSGAPSGRLRRILLTESGLMLAAGCLTGALAGFYGQFIIDAYLRDVTGFPVTSASASARPVLILALVLAAALALVAFPAWRTSNVSPALALADE